MEIQIVVKRLGNKTWTADAVFIERRLAENFIECRRAVDTFPAWEFGIVSGEIEVVAVP